MQPRTHTTRSIATAVLSLLLAMLLLAGCSSQMARHLGYGTAQLPHHAPRQCTEPATTDPPTLTDAIAAPDASADDGPGPAEPTGQREGLFSLATGDRLGLATVYYEGFLTGKRPRAD